MTPTEIQTIEALLTYPALQNILYMARCEAWTITELDKDLLGAAVEKKLVFYFAQADGYTPLEKHYHQLKKTFPTIRIYLADDERIPHAFVLGYSATVAQVTVEKLLNHLFDQQQQQQTFSLHKNNQLI